MINSILVTVITIIAIIASPIIALEIQKTIENHKEKKGRKLDIFKTLLATRGYTLSFEHVRALNMIDIEFYDCKEIREAWNLYRDHLNTNYPPNEEKKLQTTWCDKQKTYLTGLLYVMSKFFGYNDFDRVILKKCSYIPIAHSILNLEQQVIRYGFVNLLNGNNPLKVELAKRTKQPKQTNCPNT